ncbi:MAG TPA: cbb3-type cytochrome c oxidase subunit 3 [Hyphomicrobiaceae bacterium]|nr:cbb3-type cytochrome c oxidase subunit 3 [Hyphomicrobiaceae bacterium]
MTYENAAYASQMIALVLFGAVMAGVLAYAFWPGNSSRFRAAARLALEDDDCRTEKD